MTKLRTASCLLFFTLCMMPGLRAQAPASAPQTPVATETQTERINRLEQQLADSRGSADNAWMLVCSALVLMMTGPGLALFYGGLVRKKNVLSTLMQSFATSKGCSAAF